MGANVKRHIWQFFVPRTKTSIIRSFGYYAPMCVFGVSTFAILQRQSYYRPNLADEEAATYDRISRRAYVALPDGRMALVYPIIDTQMTLTRTVMSFLDAVNPFP